MFCSNCGSENSVGSKFCPKCGTKQITEFKVSDIPVKQTEELITTEFEVTRHRKKDIIIGGALGVALLIFLLLVNGVGNLGLNQSTNSILDRPAADYVVTGEALWSLQAVWGVELSDSGGPITLRELANQTFDYAVNGREVTESDVQVTFLPGNAMFSFFSRLFNSQEAIDAVKEQWLSRAG